MNFNGEHHPDGVTPTPRGAARAVEGGAGVPQLKPTVYRPSAGTQSLPMQCC